MSMHDAAGHTRLLGDWIAQQSDVNDDWLQDARTLSARHWHAYLNDPHIRAIAETLVIGVFGAEGVKFKSHYQADDLAATSDAERALRRRIDAAIERHHSGHRIDVSGHLTKRAMDVSLFLSKLLSGDGYKIRVWAPRRPWAVRGTCWRVIDAARVSNPHGEANSPRLFEGHELDADGGTVAIWVQTTHPNLVRYGQTLDWRRIPVYATDGTRQVVHTARRTRPDQVRGFGLMSAALLSMRMLSESAKAWVVAKRIQASIGLIVTCEDPEAMRRGDRNGALINGNVGIKPGMKWYVGNGTKVEPLQFNFQGNDFEQFRNPVLEAACASVSLPMDYVLQRLTKSNMASSRTALGLAYQTFLAHWGEHVEDVARIDVTSALREELARGELDVAPDDLDRIARGRFSRPPRLVPDPIREAQAAREWINLGDSFTDNFAESGRDFDARVSQRAQDQEYLTAQGVGTDLAATAQAAPADPAQQAPAQPDAADPAGAPDAAA